MIPNIVGFALYSPPLDGIGNSARGVQFAEELVKLYEFHAFDGIGGSISGKKNPRVKGIISTIELTWNNIYRISKSTRRRASWRS